MSDIFISYRRDDAGGFAGALLRDLNGAFDEGRIFMDVESIKGGFDFASMIDEEVRSCEVLIAIIGKQWLSQADADGNRRLDDPGDLVRVEIATALREGKVVVPILVKGTRMPTASELPEDLQALARRNAVEISNNNWRGDVDELIEVLEQHLIKTPASQIRAAADVKSYRRSALLMLIVPWSIAALVTLPMMAMRLPSEVEISLKVHRISFQVDAQGAAGFATAIPTSSLTLQAFEWIELGQTGLDIAATFDQEGEPLEWNSEGRGTYSMTSETPEWSSVTFDAYSSLSEAGIEAADLELNRLDLSAGTRVTLSWNDFAPESLQIQALGAQISGSVNAPEHLQLRCDRCVVSRSSGALVADSGEESLVALLGSTERREVLFTGSEDGSTVSLDLAHGAAVVKQDVHVASELRFLGGRVPEVTSSILGDGGKITFEDLDRTVEVREGEFVYVGDSETLLLRSLKLEDGISVSLHGEVKSLSTGTAGFVAERVPNLWEWTRIKVPWLIYVIGLALLVTTALGIHQLRLANRRRRKS